MVSSGAWEPVIDFINKYISEWTFLRVLLDSASASDSLGDSNDLKLLGVRMRKLISI